MSFSFSNFAYDPTRDGIDSSSWAFLSGDPYILDGKLVLTNSSVLHRGDCVRGDLTMNITFPSSPTFDLRTFGFYSPGSGSYAWFKVETNSLWAQISDGNGNDDSEEIEWSDGVNEIWEGYPINFRIQWEAGLVKFYVNGTLKTTLTDSAIPTLPMAVYFSNSSNDDLFKVGYVNVTSIQSFYMHTDESDTEVDALVKSKIVGQPITVGENVVNDLTHLTGIISETVGISESSEKSLLKLPTMSTDAVSISEDVAPVVE